MGGVLVPANTPLYGTVRIEGQRMAVTVNSIESGGNILPVELTAYDMDGQAGLFVPNTAERTAMKEAAANIGGSFGTSISFARSASQQLVMDVTRGVLSGGSQYLATKMREVKVAVKANYQLLLISKSSNQMKTRIILSLIMLLTVLSVKAQEPVETKIFPTNQIISPHKIEVTFQKTVHILFPSEVKYVDLGSFDIIADKATGAENVVRIKAAVKGFEGETNFSVITADGCFYSFNVVYKDEPAQLSIEMEDWLRDNPEGGIAGDRMFVKLKELGGETPLVVNRIMYTLYKKNKRDIRHIGCKKYGIQTLLKGLYINNDLLYLHTSLRNSSDISFDIDYIRFKVVDKKVAKRTAMQENFIEPVRTYNRLITVDGKATVRNIFVLPKLTLPDDKLLVVEIYEKGGARHQSFRIENTDLVAAKPISELHLK